MATIELKGAPFFHIPGKLHLSVETPGPLEINPSNFTEQEKGWINNAHAQGRVFVVNPEGPSSREPPTTNKPAPATPVASETTSLELQKAKELIKMPWPALKTLVPGLSSPRLLRLLKEQESSKKKPRSALVKMLDEKISNFEEAVTRSVGQEDVAGHLAQDPSRVDPDIVSDITEIEERKVIVRPATEDDFASMDYDTLGD